MSELLDLHGRRRRPTVRLLGVQLEDHTQTKTPNAKQRCKNLQEAEGLDGDCVSTGLSKTGSYDPVSPERTLCSLSGTF